MKKMFLLFSVLFSTLFMSCSLLNQEASSSIIVNLPAAQTRAAAPDYVAKYEIKASCSSLDYDKTLTVKGSTASSVEFSKLNEGTYTISVKAFDSASKIISEGKDTVKVESGKTAQANIVLEYPTETFGISGTDVFIIAYYESDPTKLYNYVKEYDIPASIPIKNDTLIFEVTTIDDSFDYSWNLNRTEREGGDNSNKFTLNPAESFAINPNGINILSCEVYGNDIEKSGLFKFSLSNE